MVEQTGNEADHLGYIQLEYHHHGCMASKSPVRKKICRVVPRHLTLPHPQLCHRHLALSCLVLADNGVSGYLVLLVCTLRSKV